VASWLSALARTREKISGAISKVFSLGKKLDNATVEELETVLLQADVPLRIVTDVMAKLNRAFKSSSEKPAEILRKILIEELGAQTEFRFGPVAGTSPQVILLVGINGSGKTTTAAKLAHDAKKAGRKPLLGAADTFRAAGSSQLQLWAGRLGVEVVGGSMGADAAAVAFDAVAAAQTRNCDVLIVDTAGRMHTKQPLMVELQKVRRALVKKIETAPHETWIVLDASIGQNALNQAKQFHEMVPLTGVIITKLDGSSKAGVLFAINADLKLPIRFVGLGEQADDLVPFSAEDFVDALLGNESSYKAP
jgi:fused signal recognition particle receptor